jgi:hypothetical protein
MKNGRLDDAYLDVLIKRLTILSSGDGGKDEPKE